MESFTIWTRANENHVVTPQNINDTIPNDHWEAIYYCIVQDKLLVAIAFGADVQSCYCGGATLVNFAIAHKSYDSLRVLLDHGVKCHPILFDPLSVTKPSMQILLDYNTTLPAGVHADVIEEREKHLEHTLQCITLMRFHGGVYRDVASTIGKHLWSMRWEK